MSNLYKRVCEFLDWNVRHRLALWIAGPELKRKKNQIVTALERADKYRRLSEDERNKRIHAESALGRAKAEVLSRDFVKYRDMIVANCLRDLQNKCNSKDVTPQDIRLSDEWERANEPRFESGMLGYITDKLFAKALSDFIGRFLADARVSSGRNRRIDSGDYVYDLTIDAGPIRGSARRAVSELELNMSRISNRLVKRT